MKSVFLMLALLVNTSAFAANLNWNSDWQTFKLGGGITVNPAATESIPLSQPYYVKNLVIQAEGVTSQSTIEVMVNGQVKGTIYAPGRDPSYVVTVAETARSIEFRYRDGGAMRIISVTGTVSGVFGQPAYHFGLGGLSGSRDELVGLANKALRQIEVLSQYAQPSDEATYLFPIKRNAGMVYVMATSHGDLSRSTTAQLVALSDQIAFADAYLNQLMQLQPAYEPVIELIAVKETIRAILQ